MKKFAILFSKSALFFILVILVIIMTLRYLTPDLNRFRAQITSYVQNKADIALTIDSINLQWDGFIPLLQLNGIAFINDKYQGEASEVSIGFDIIGSLLHQRYQFKEITFNNLFLTINNNVDDSVKNDTQIVNPVLLSDKIRGYIDSSSLFTDILLQQFQHFSLKNSVIQFHSLTGSNVRIMVNDLFWTNQSNQHWAKGTIELSDAFGNFGRVLLKVQLSDKASLLDTGSIYFKVSNINMKTWLNRWIREKTGLESADFSLSSWVNIKKGALDSIVVKFPDGLVKWRDKQEQEHSLTIEQQTLFFNKQPNGWLLNIPSFNLKTDNLSWPKGDIKVRWLKNLSTLSHRENEVRVRANHLSLDRITPVISMFAFADTQILRRWEALSPLGALDNLSVDLPLDNLKNTRFYSRWTNIHWNNVRILPGIDHFSGQALGTFSKGSIVLQLANSKLPYAGFFKEPLAIDNAAGKISWVNDSNGFHVEGKNLKIQSPDLSIKGALFFRLDNDGQPWLNIAASADLSDAKQAWRYYPESLMSKGLINYLSQSIQGGSVQDATIIFSGNPKEFPYSKKEGVFQIDVPLQHTVFQFDPHWPTLSGFPLNLDFLNDSLTMKANSIKLGKVIGKNIVALIPHYNKEKLYITADVEGKGNDIHEYFLHTPLKESVAKGLEEVNVRGVIKGSLKLDIPLDSESEDKVKATGNVNFKNNTLHIAPLDLDLKDTQGSFSFNDGNLSGKNLSATWFGIPFTFDFKTYENSKKDYYLDIAMGGVTDTAKIPWQFKNELSGLAPWKGDVNVVFKANHEVTYNSFFHQDLSHVSSELPVPLSKNLKENFPLEFKTIGDLHQFSIQGVLGRYNFNSHWKIDGNNTELTRLLIAPDKKNKEKKKAIKNQYNVEINEINLDRWIELLGASGIGSHQGQKKNVKYSLSYSPSNIMLKIDNILFMGQEWHNIDAHYERMKKEQSIAVSGDEIQGKAVAQTDNHWNIALDYLYLNPFTSALKNKERNKSKNKENDQLSLTSFDGWPSVNLQCKECWILGQRLNHVSFNIESHPLLLSLNDGLIDTGNDKLHFSGKWSLDHGQSKTAIDANLALDNFSKTKEFLGIDIPIEGQKLHAKVDLNWAGLPWSPNLTTVNGNLSSSLGQGKVDLDSGTAEQFLRFLSFDALLRKLQFDFRDVFSKNFFFNGITSNSKIEDGILTLNKLSIDGLSADIKLIGTLNLSDEKLNMIAEVSPEISAGVGVAAGFAVNPVAGIAVYVGSKIFSPIWSNIFMIKYDIGGTLQHPEVNQKEIQHHEPQK